MSSHFVESHSGGYYFSSEDPSVIEGLGEDSGNGDNIVFSFDEEDLEEPIKSMMTYLTRNLVFTRDGLIEKLNYFHMEQIGVHAAITEVKCNAIYEIDNNKDLLKIMYEENKLDIDTYNTLIALLNECLTKQLEYIKNLDKIGLAMSIAKKKEKKKES